MNNEKWLLGCWTAPLTQLGTPGEASVLHDRFQVTLAPKMLTPPTSVRTMGERPYPWCHLSLNSRATGNLVSLRSTPHRSAGCLASQTVTLLPYQKGLQLPFA